MIVDLIFAAVKAIIQPVLNIFPTFSLVTILNLPTTIGRDVGDYLHPLDGIFPVTELLTMIYGAMLVILAFYAAYKIANWAWRHIPDLGGFGPGAG